MKASNSGFGLIEVMIAVAVSAILLLGMVSVFQNMNAASNSLKGKMGSISLSSSLLQTMSSSASCLGHLMPGYTTFNLAKAQSAGGMPLGFTGDDGVSNIYGNDPAQTSLPPIALPNYDVSVAYLVFRTSGPAGTTSTGANLYLGSLVVSLLKLTDGAQAVTGGRGLREMTIGALELAVDSTNTIVDCFAQPLNAIDACASLGGNYVQTATPPCELPYPCSTGFVFMGYDTAQNPICNSAAAVTVLNCPAGHTAVGDSTGTSYVCN